MIELTDDLSRTVRLASPAQRIVCLVPSITETLFTLGAGERLAGITDYCIHPQAEVKTKTRVGGTKNFCTQKVLALEPDLVVANAEENRKHQIDQLERAGLNIFVTFPKTVDGCLKMIADMAILTGTAPAAEPVLASIRKARSAAQAAVRDPLPGVLCPIWKDPYLTINRDTFIDSVILSCGGRNIFSDCGDRYPQFTLEEAARLRPEVVLLPTEPYRFTDVHVETFAQMGEAVPAVRDRRIHIVEGELLSWYGPRLARAFATIAPLLRST